LLHKRAKPIHPPYIHPSAHLSTQTSTLLPCFANAKPLPEAGNNNYLGSECDHLPEAGNTYIGIHPMRSARPYLRLLIVGAAEGGERRQLIRRRHISLKRDNHPQNHCCTLKDFVFIKILFLSEQARAFKSMATRFEQKISFNKIELQNQLKQLKLYSNSSFSSSSSASAARFGVLIDRS
jgi:hypothetical protein